MATNQNSVKHRLTYKQLEDYGVAGTKILVNVKKGRYKNYTAEILQFDDNTDTGIYVIYFDDNIRLLRTGVLNEDFEFLSLKKQYALMQKYNYNEPKSLNYNELVDISLDFLYLTEPFLESYTNMSTMLNYRKEFPPYIFNDEVYLKDNNRYKFIFEGGRFFVFRVEFSPNSEETYIKVLEHTVSSQNFKLITKYDSLKLDIVKNLNKYFNKTSDLDIVKTKIIEIEDFKLEIKANLLLEKQKLYKNLTP